MIANSWVISGIIGGVILLLIIPLLLFIRYGKEGRKAFSQVATKNVNNQIHNTKAQLQKLNLKQEILRNKDNLVTFKTSQSIKKTKKEIILIKRRLSNLKIKKQNQEKMLQKLTKNKALKK